MEFLSAGYVTERNQSNVPVISPLGVVSNGSKKRRQKELYHSVSSIGQVIVKGGHSP